MSALWEIDEQIRDITESLVDEETGEINEEAIELLEQLGIERDEKLENIGIVLKTLEFEIDAIHNEIKALKRRAEVKLNKHNRLSEYVKKSLGGKTFETSKVAFSYRRTQSVNVVNEEIVPDEWCKFETTRKPIKMEIKKALKNGENVPGCVLEDNVRLQIK